MINSRAPGFLLIVSLIILTQCSKKSQVTSLPAIPTENNKITGASASDLLTSAKYTSAIVEIQYMPGFQPDANAINNTVTFLNSFVNKPGGIQVTQKQINSSGKSSLTINEIALIEQGERTAFTGGTVLSLYILFADAAYSEPAVLGVAYRNTSICLFAKTINDNSGAIGQASRTKLETAVLQHETGHLSGLVDIGSPMQTNHKDAAHGNHCNNSNCLMYYTSETTDLLGFLVTGNVPVLDAACLNDLHANGGK